MIWRAPTKLTSKNSKGSFRPAPAATETVKLVLRPFSPLFTNPHVLTVAASLWPRTLDERRFPVEARLFRTEPDTQVLVHVQRPEAQCAGDVILVHGLEGSSSGGYMRSMAQAALEAGFAAHRFNLRNCGGDGSYSSSIYNGGQTSDLLAYLRDLQSQGRPPAFVVGFSLGGNIALKLAGELGDSAAGLIAAVCAVSTPIDLGASCRQVGRRSNRLYERRFVRAMSERIRAMCRRIDGFFPVEELERIHSLYEFDDRVTAPLSGFRDAEHYYGTQSAVKFLDRIRIPARLIQARDDPMVPFNIYGHPSIAANSNILLTLTEHGGHMGFLSRSRPRFWLDETVVAWITEMHARIGTGERYIDNAG